MLVAPKKQMENTSSAVPQICIIYYTEREYNMLHKLTQKDFLKRARKVHGYKYLGKRLCKTIKKKHKTTA